MIPSDPVMLLSYVNLKLRDFYPSLDAFCDDIGEDKDKITAALEKIDYRYSAEKNQFV